MKKDQANELLIKDIDSLHQLIEKSPSLSHCTLQSLDLRTSSIDWDTLTINDITLLGCELGSDVESILRKKGALIFPRQNHLPYDPYRKDFYTWQELMEGFNPTCDECLDWKIYSHFYKSKNNPGIKEALFQRIHDHAIDDCLRQLLEYNPVTGMPSKKCIGIMGGHGVLRTDPFYQKTAATAYLLAQAGYYIVSGGGPGIMEATNLGAYMANYSQTELADALEMIAPAAYYTDPGYMDLAVEVLSKYPRSNDNLAIPTWFYGHEPSNLFATRIAKYFSNSIREDNLLAISLYGVIFAPGSAGTTQEIFQDAAQNHYATYDFYSPMVFLGKERYEIQTSLFPLLKQLSWERTYGDLLFLSDEPDEILEFIRSHPPIRKEI